MDCAVMGNRVAGEVIPRSCRVLESERKGRGRARRRGRDLLYSASFQVFAVVTYAPAWLQCVPPAVTLAACPDLQACQGCDATVEGDSAAHFSDAPGPAGTRGTIDDADVKLPQCCRPHALATGSYIYPVSVTNFTLTCAASRPSRFLPSTYFLQQGENNRPPCF